MGSDVLAQVEGALLRVTINRPEKRNALSRSVLGELREAFEAHARDETLRAAVVTGAGDKSFVAGGDLRDLDLVRSIDDSRALFDAGNAAFQAIRTFPVPVVAAVNGLAVGGGAELAVACDVRIAAAHARIGFVQATLAIPTAWGGGSDLMAIVGPARGLALLADARVLGADDALRAGLVDAVAPQAEDFAAFVARFLAPWLARTPRVMRAFKWQSAARKLGLTREATDVRDRELFALAWSHADHWEAAKDVLDRGSKP